MSGMGYMMKGDMDSMMKGGMNNGSHEFYENWWNEGEKGRKPI